MVHEEAGKHGAETRGIFRLHQFEKVEMVYICKPEDSFKYLEEMRKRAEKICEMLNLPYKTILLSTGDAGFASAKTYDIGIEYPRIPIIIKMTKKTTSRTFGAILEIKEDNAIFSYALKNPKK